MKIGLLLSLFIVTLAPASGATDQPVTPLPAPGQWDGITEKAKLDRPYEQPLQAYAIFPLSSFFLHPWRAYMDTQPASHFLGSMGFNSNTSPEATDAVLQILNDAGIRKARVEFGWGLLDWNNQLTGPYRTGFFERVTFLKKYNMRPLLLLNANHGDPCPLRDLMTQLLADAKKGDHSFKINPQDLSKIHLGYTGPMDDPDYCAAKPLIIATQPDGTCQLSGPLMQDIKAGSFRLVELKYLPLHGSQLAGANPQTVADLAASEQATADGWRQYVGQMCDAAMEALGTKGNADAGFDVEVWNERTFGSDFLDLSNYYNPKLTFADQPTYQKTRPLGPGVRPDAPTDFKKEGADILTGITIDYVRSRPELAMVKVDDGMGNQAPFNGGGNSWPGQDAYSRHYYTGSSLDINPANVQRRNFSTIDALGHREGTHTSSMSESWMITPGTNFIPTFRVGFPEWEQCSFWAEDIARDVIPDSRWGGEPLVHGRFTQNGDYHRQELWETEVNVDRSSFFQQVFKESKAAQDDPRAYALDGYIAGKMALRQYIFHNHKGVDNYYLFASDGHEYYLAMFEPPFFNALKDSHGQLTAAVRAQIPAYLKGLGWLTKQMESADPIVATRALRVDELWEYKPRLMYAGDGTPAHPNQWNRDWFAFLPYQLTASKYVIPYYVVTVDAFKSWHPEKDPLDPMRYQMPDQDFEVTIGNCAGAGAKVSAYDPMTNTAVPVNIVPEKSSSTHLTVRLKTVDYPRYLLIEEAQAGPLIQNPQVTADENGTLHVGWKTNLAIEAVKITYGKDWPNRGANEKMVPVQNTNTYSVYVPTGTKGILAARISVSANGLSCVWPRWDEDLQGQVVVPGSAPADVQRLKLDPVGDTSNAPVLAIPLVADNSVALPLEKVGHVYDYIYKLQLPAGTIFANGLEDDQQAVLDKSKNIRLRISYLSEGNHFSINSSLPFHAVGDNVTQTSVKLPSGKMATLVDMIYMPVLHPEMSGNLARKALFVPTGHNDADFLVLSAEGMPDDIKSDDAMISSIFASCQTMKGPH